MSKFHFLIQSVTLCLLLVANLAYAQDLSLMASVDRTRISLAEDVTLQITVSGTDLDGVPEPRLASMPDFQVVGRSSSTSSNISIINGKITSSRTIQYIYRLRPQNTGGFTIDPAIIVTANRTYRTDPIRIDVVAGSGSGGSSSSSRNDPMGQGQGQPDPGEDISDDLFIRARVDRNTAYIGEQVTVTYTLYTRVSLSNVQYDRLPAFTGFLAEEVFTAQRLEYDQEIVDGKRYNTVVIKRIALFPTIEGIHDLDSYSLVCHVPVRRRRSLLDSFFDDPLTGSFDSLFSRSQAFTLTTQPQSIEVLPLPAAGKPSPFSGGVGSFSIKGQIDTAQPSLNQPFTLTITLSGKGNIKTVDGPELPDFKKFKQYASSNTENIGHSGGSVSGKKVYKHVLIPLQAGDMEIAPATFTYFDPRNKVYKTAMTEPIKLRVAPGADGESSMAYTSPKEDVRQVRQDIQYIKPAGIVMVHEGGYLYQTPWFIFLNLAPILGLMGAFVYRTHTSRLQKDVGYARWRRARGETRKLLNAAADAMKQNHLDQTFAHIATALHRYMGDKLNVSVAGMTVPQVLDLLRERDLDPETVESVKHCLDACDMARFAPTALTEDSAREVLDTAREVIEALEQKMTKRS